jgi:hypothetical protein
LNRIPRTKPEKEPLGESETRSSIPLSMERDLPRPRFGQIRNHTGSFQVIESSLHSLTSSCF